MRVLAGSIVLGLGVVACNPKGTCIPPQTKAAGDPECIVNDSKRACEARSNQAQFFADEDGTFGTIRCKSLGYDDWGASQAKDANELHVYYKK